MPAFQVLLVFPDLEARHLEEIDRGLSRDVRDRVTIAGDELMAGELLVHDRETPLDLDICLESIAILEAFRKSEDGKVVELASL